MCVTARTGPGQSLELEPYPGFPCVGSGAKSMSHHHPVSTAVLAGSWIRTRATRTPTSTWKWDADVTSGGLTYRAMLVKLVVSNTHSLSV